jgi:hypothetical protein
MLTPPALTVAPFRGADAVRAGLLTRRRLAGSAWVRLFPDIYAYAEVPLTHRVWCEAAILLLPKGSAIVGRSAAALWGVRGLGEPDRVCALVPRYVRPHPGLEIHRGAPSDVTSVFGIPVTTPERTAFDLARFLPRVEAVIYLDALLQQRKVYLDRLVFCFADHPGWLGHPLADIALGLAEPLAESPMETRLRLLAVDAGLPRPVAQYKIMRGKRFVARVDYAYPEYKIALEYDGDHHRDRTTFRFDMERQNELHVMGWTVLRFNADDVLRRPEQTAAMIRAVLKRAGWPLS